MSAIALLHWHHVHEDAACRLFDVMKSPTPGRSSLTPPNLKLFSFPKEQKLFLGGRGEGKMSQSGVGYGGEGSRDLHNRRALSLNEPHILKKVFRNRTSYLNI